MCCAFIAAFSFVVAAAQRSAADISQWQPLTFTDGIPIRGLAIDPTNPSILYASISNGAIAFDEAIGVPAEGGGIARSTDGGTSWTLIIAGLTNYNVVAVVIDPSTPTTVYAATDGGGVFKSTTSGDFWTESSTGLPEEGEVYALVIDPLTPTTLYAGLEHDGVYKSVDGGATWSEANVGLDLNFATLEIWALAVDPQNPANLYAGTRDGVFKSTDGAATWERGGTLGWTNYDDGSTNGSFWVYAIAVDPTHPQTVYVGTLDAGGVLRSDDGGETFTSATAGIDYYAGYSYITALVVDPNDPDVIYAGTQDRGVFKSVNGGAHWSPLNAGFTRPGVYAIALDSNDPATVFAGTVLGGIYRLEDKPLALDHFRCFRARGPKVDVPPVELIDALETRTTAVGRPKAFCEPVSISDSPVLDSTAYLTCYSISRGDYDGSQLVGFDTFFSAVPASKIKPATLCVPTQRQGIPSVLAVDTFKGYSARKTDAAVFAVTVDGPLGSQDAKFYRTASFMMPVHVDGSSVADESSRLVCHELRYKQHGFAIAEPSSTRQSIDIENQFGPQTLQIDEPQALCLAGLGTFIAQ